MFTTYKLACAAVKVTSLNSCEVHHICQTLESCGLIRKCKKKQQTINTVRRCCLKMSQKILKFLNVLVPTGCRRNNSSINFKRRNFVIINFALSGFNLLFLYHLFFMLFYQSTVKQFQFQQSNNKK